MIDAGNVKELERFHTDLQEIFGMLQCRQDKEKLLHYVKVKNNTFGMWMKRLIRYFENFCILKQY